jgi:hypothetical protein
MEAEFVNMFVQKQKDTMVDFLLKNVMLEARIALAETKLRAQEDELQRLQIVESSVKPLEEEILSLRQENLNLRKTSN